MKERVYQVFGSQILDELVEIGVRERDLFLPPPSVPPSQAIAEYRSAEPEDPPVRRFRLSGFFSRPQVQKANRNSIYIFVNGRLIRDRLVLHALSSAYYNLMPPSAYPFALLFLECDAEEVDVNVHPSKTEVRFRHGTFVHDFVRDTIRERLMESRPSNTFSPAPLPAPPAQPAARAAVLRIQPDDGERAAGGGGSGRSRGGAGSAAAHRGRTGDAGVHAARFGRARRRAWISARRRSKWRPVRRLPASSRAASTCMASFRRTRFRAPEMSLSVLSDLRPLGQIHESFIIAAGRDGLWIIDQHVAHERILFEQVLKQRAAGRVEMQRLLMPMILQLTPEQQIDYARIAEELHASGFETEPFGNRTIAVKAAPANVGPQDLERILFEILEIAENEMRSASLDDLRRNICASIACRAAIKINMRLDFAKMEWLLRALAATDCPMSCPHGRPIAMHYSTREILKAFHRI